MKKTLFKAVVGIFMLSGFGSAYAELFINPVTKLSMGAREGSAHFGTSTVTYDSGGSNGDVDRTFLGATVAYGMNNLLDVYGTFSYTMKAKAEGIPGDDSGYILGGGVRGGIPNDMGLKLHGYAQLLLINEDYGSESFFGTTIEYSGKETSIMAGVVASKALENKVVVYGGLELNLVSDADIKVSGYSGGSGRVSVDRDDFLGFRLGANFDAGDFLLNVNTSLIHETGIFISGSKPF